MQQQPRGAFTLLVQAQHHSLPACISSIPLSLSLSLVHTCTNTLPQPISHTHPPTRADTVYAHITLMHVIISSLLLAWSLFLSPTHTLTHTHTFQPAKRFPTQHPLTCTHTHTPTQTHTHTHTHTHLNTHILRHKNLLCHSPPLSSNSIILLFSPQALHPSIYPLHCSYCRHTRTHKHTHTHANVCMHAILFVPQCDNIDDRVCNSEQDVGPSLLVVTTAATPGL